MLFIGACTHTHFSRNVLFTDKPKIITNLFKLIRTIYRMHLYYALCYALFIMHLYYALYYALIVRMYSTIYKPVLPFEKNFS